MGFRQTARIAASGAAAGAAVLALGLAGTSGAAAAGSGQVNLVDLSVQQGVPPVGTAMVVLSVHNAGPDDAAGPVDVAVLLVHTRAATDSLPTGCTAVGGSAGQGARLVHCALGGAVPVNGAAGVSIPLVAAGSGPMMLALVHVGPALDSHDVDIDGLNNQAIFEIS